MSRFYERGDGYLVGISHADDNDWTVLGSFRTYSAARGYLASLPPPDGRWQYEIHGLDGSGSVEATVARDWEL